MATAMALTAILFALFITSQAITAAPNCDRNSLTNCLMPMVSYAMGPGAEDLVVAMDSMSFTDKQFGDFCRIGISFIDCYRAYVIRCGTGLSDAQEFAVKTAQLIRKCDNPSFGRNARTLFQCSATLNRTKTKTAACSNAAMRWMQDDLRGLMPSSNGRRLDLTGWNSGAIFDGLCCNIKYYRQCSGSEINDKCGPQAQQVFDSFHDAMMSTYECNTRTKSCPGRPDPSPEDYTSKLDMEIMSLFTDNTADNTYTPMRYKASSSNLVHASYTFTGMVLLIKTLFSSRWIC